MKPETLAAYAGRNIPRYTSYPTAPNFTAAVGEGAYRAWLGALDPRLELSLYLHVPFCRSMCWYCGCHTTVTARQEPVSRYLAAMGREAELVAAALPAPMKVRHVHFGGGSPTLMRPEQMAALMARLRARFAIADGAEIAIEIDPRTLEAPMIAALADAGVNRASIGVQSFDPKVQRAINRVQPYETVSGAVAALRGHGIGAINFDLIYGLPGQTAASCIDTVERALRLEPDRFAVFGYAHVPAFKRHQRKIDSALLPGGAARWEQAAAIAATLAKAGYVAVGLDHYARPDDGLARALAAGALHRNFQGYTTDGCGALIGLGASSIGRLPEGYVQNAVSISDYQRQIGDGALPIARGYAADADDRLRAAVIERLMCDQRVDLEAVCAMFGADPADLLAAVDLEPLLADELIEQAGWVIEVRPEARPLVRVAAAAFDAHLTGTRGQHARAL